MTQEVKKAYATPALTVYGGVVQLTQRSSRFGDYMARSSSHSSQTFGHMSHMPLIAPSREFTGRFFHGSGRR